MSGLTVYLIFLDFGEPYLKGCVSLEAYRTAVRFPFLFHVGNTVCTQGPRGSQIVTLRPRTILFSYLGPLGFQDGDCLHFPRIIVLKAGLGSGLMTQNLI